MRILLVSYHLYPDSTSEGLCVSKVARALKDAGHDVVVVTSTVNQLEGEQCVPRAGLLRDIPVYRVAPDASLVPAWSRPFYSLGHRFPTRATLGGKVWGRLPAVPGIVLACAEEDYAWVAAAGRVAADLCNAGPPFDVIHSRLNHSNSHLAVLHARPRLRRRIPWCAHFSDPWPHHLYPDGYRSRAGVISRFRSEQVLDRILDEADSLTFPSARLLRYLLSGCRERYRTKAHAVAHLGNCWLGRPQREADGRFRLLHAGLLLKQRSPAHFFEALQQFLAANARARDVTSVEFVGRNASDADAAARRFGVGDVVHTSPHTSPETVWTALCSASVLLLIESPMEEGIFMPSKLADYVSSGRPILALSPSLGTVADCLSQGGGIRVDPADVSGIAGALGHLFERWETGRLDELAPPARLVEQFSPPVIAAAYEAAFTATRVSAIA